MSETGANRHQCNRCKEEIEGNQYCYPQWEPQGTLWCTGCRKAHSEKQASLREAAAAPSAEEAAVAGAAVATAVDTAVDEPTQPATTPGAPE